MLHQLARIATLGLLCLAGAGCCCVQGLPAGGCSSGGCGGGLCGSGPLMGLAGCRGACGEVYVDEWISEPPVVDNCGPNCGGCQRCYQPVRSVLRQLWGRPFVTSCDTGLGGPSCDSGCDACSSGCSTGTGFSSRGLLDSGYAPSRQGTTCNCGQSHEPAMHFDSGSSSHHMHTSPMPSTPVPAPALPNQSHPSSQVPQAAPELIPNPSVTPSSATRRLNPALSRHR